MYCYIAPTVTDVDRPVRVGASRSFLLAFGVGLVIGTWVAGRLADWSVFRSVLVGFRRQHRGAGAVLPALAVPPSRPVAAWSSLVGVLGSVLAINLQLRLMDVAGDAQTLGAAMNHAVAQHRQRARRLARRRS